MRVLKARMMPWVEAANPRSHAILLPHTCMQVLRARMMPCVMALNPQMNDRSTAPHLHAGVESQDDALRGGSQPSPLYNVYSLYWPAPACGC